MKSKNPVFDRVLKTTRQAGEIAKADVENISYISLLTDLSDEDGQIHVEAVSDVDTGIDMLIVALSFLLESIPEGNDREEAKADIINAILAMFDGVDGKKEEPRQLN